MDNDHERVKAGVIAMLRIAGEDIGRPGLLRTPERFLAAWIEMTERPGDPGQILATTFDDSGPVDEMVKFGPIQFTSVCEHHLMPFTGTVVVAYIPDGKVVGLSKVPRLVEHFARRPQIQERMTHQITSAIDKHVTNQGSAAVIEAMHSCCASRGIRKQVGMTTSSLTGLFRDDARARAEFLAWARG